MGKGAVILRFQKDFKMTESSINIIIKTNSLTSITRRGGATSVLNRTQIKNMQSRYLRNFFLVDLICVPFKMGVASTFPFSLFNTSIVNINLNPANIKSSPANISSCLEKGQRLCNFASSKYDKSHCNR